MEQNMNAEIDARFAERALRTAARMAMAASIIVMGIGCTLCLTSLTPARVAFSVATMFSGLLLFSPAYAALLEFRRCLPQPFKPLPAQGAAESTGQTTL